MICVYVSGHKGVDGIRGVPVSIPARDRNALVGAWGGFGRTTGRARAYGGWGGRGERGAGPRMAF